MSVRRVLGGGFTAVLVLLVAARTAKADAPGLRTRPAAMVR
ncbi:MULTISPECIES: hypothetical protein [unclassified Leucobacter]|nr:MULTISPECIES: hypothetical protein [unclassified Leucobacter]